MRREFARIDREAEQRRKGDRRFHIGMAAFVAVSLIVGGLSGWVIGGALLAPPKPLTVIVHFDQPLTVRLLPPAEKQ